jgi:hypothetical protein
VVLVEGGPAVVVGEAAEVEVDVPSAPPKEQAAVSASPARATATAAFPVTLMETLPYP